MDTTTIITLLWIASAIGGSYVAGQKHRPAFEGLMFGAFFGPIGIVIESCMPTGDKMPPQPGFLSRWI